MPRRERTLLVKTGHAASPRRETPDPGKVEPGHLTQNVTRIVTTRKPGHRDPRSNPITSVATAWSTSGTSSRRRLVETRTAPVSGGDIRPPRRPPFRDRYPSRNAVWRRSSTRNRDSYVPRIRAIAASSSRSSLLDRLGGENLVSHTRNVSSMGDRRQSPSKEESRDIPVTPLRIRQCCSREGRGAHPSAIRAGDTRSPATSDCGGRFAWLSA